MKFIPTHQITSTIHLAAFAALSKIGSTLSLNLFNAFLPFPLYEKLTSAKSGITFGAFPACKIKAWILYSFLIDCLNNARPLYAIPTASQAFAPFHGATAA
jgi:hypothetical protein